VPDVPVVIMRGGTSKGVFVSLDQLPAGAADRDRMLLRLMGSPDPMQLDGLGGTHSSTSKVMAVGPSAEPGADVDYLFAQVAVDEAVVDLTGNCGNLTAAVAPYAIDEGLVPAIEPVTVVRLRNLNTGVVVEATVPVNGGRAAWEGDTVIDGVPGTGAAVVTSYLDPSGSVTGALFPTGLAAEDLDGHRVSIVDVASPYVFLAGDRFDLHGRESPAQLNSRPELLGQLDRIRREAGRRIGVDSRAVPRLVLVHEGDDLRVLATSMGRIHHAVPITGALCIGAAARLPGTVVHDLARPAPDDGPAGPGETRSSETVRIEHPKGVVEATVDLDGDRVLAAGVVRTARRLLTGTAHL
jgi:2-methylaconitate cis-trans-isomerase PrpF